MPSRSAIEAERNEVARPHRHIGIEREFLRHVSDRGGLSAAVEGDAAAAGNDEAEDGANQRRLARAVGADQPTKFARSQREVDIAQDVAAGKRDARLTDRENLASGQHGAQCFFSSVSVDALSVTAFWRASTSASIHDW